MGLDRFAPGSNQYKKTIGDYRPDGSVSRDSVIELAQKADAKPETATDLGEDLLASLSDGMQREFSGSTGVTCEVSPVDGDSWTLSVSDGGELVGSRSYRCVDALERKICSSLEPKVLDSPVPEGHVLALRRLMSSLGYELDASHSHDLLLIHGGHKSLLRKMTGGIPIKQALEYGGSQVLSDRVSEIVASTTPESVAASTTPEERVELSLYLRSPVWADALSDGKA